MCGGKVCVGVACCAVFLSMKLPAIVCSLWKMHLPLCLQRFEKPPGYRLQNII
uniref:Uncharacterized protein n=2 Tax=Anguilla anguilla TaxID=7936 RepID=A0A0E9V193_ANGAN